MDGINMETNIELKRKNLRKEFEMEIGINLYNEDNEIDIDYVLWLENIIINKQGS
jgi:hypothetical protein